MNKRQNIIAIKKRGNCMFKDIVSIGRNGIIYGFGQVMHRLIGFLLVPIYTRYLSPTDYGVAALLLLTTAFAETLWNYATTDTLSRFYYNYKKKKDQKQVISTSLIIQIVFAITTTILVLLYSSQLSQLLFSTTKYTLLIKIAFITFLIQTTNSIGRTVLRLEDKPGIFTAINLTQFATGMTFNIIFIVFLKMGLLGIFLGGLAGTIIAFLLLIPKLLLKVGLKFSISKAKPMMKFALPLIPASILNFLLMNTDIFMLQRLSTTAQVGLYNLAISFGGVINYFIGGPFVFLIWAPFVFSRIKIPKIKETFSRIQTYFIFLLVFGGLGLSILIKPVLSFLVGAEFFEIYKVVPLIVLAFTFSALFYVFTIGLHIKKKTKIIPVMLIVATIINISINIILIPKIGYMGAAIAKIVTFLILSIIAYIVSFKTYHIPLEKRVGYLVITAGIYYFISTLISVPSVAYQIALNLLLGLSFPIMLYAIGFFREDEKSKFKEIIRQLKSIKKSDLQNIFHKHSHIEHRH